MLQRYGKQSVRQNFPPIKYKGPEFAVFGVPGLRNWCLFLILLRFLTFFVYFCNLKSLTMSVERNSQDNKNAGNNGAENGYVRTTGSFTEHLKAVKRGRWIRFSVVSLLFFGWVVWLQNPWVLIAYPLLIDIYLTHYIPFTAWRGWKNNVARTIMGWVDAIVYALICCYFLFAFVGQQYQIPSSSLEKSLLVGDFLWVNKITYGPRVPNTPLHFPLAQNTLPILNCKSYIDKPQLEYHRLKGLRGVERNDIVVFNFPAGDTVAEKVQNPDYYTLVAQFGRETVWNNPQQFGKVFYRPVDRRENYVKRCLGLPGERLKIVDNIVYINGEPLREPTNVQYNYIIQTSGGMLGDSEWETLGVNVDDRHLECDGRQYLNNSAQILVLRSLGLNVGENGETAPIYIAPLTAAAVAEARKMPAIAHVVMVPEGEMFPVYPISKDYGWTRSNYGEIWIPKKGESIALTTDNLPIYERPIRNYEGNDLRVADGVIYINGKPATSYTFKMDYYWMMGDNRDNSADSRYWGFVPEDHIVGTPVLILLSLEKDKGIFDGKIRWNRIFRLPNHDK